MKEGRKGRKKGQRKKKDRKKQERKKGSMQERKVNRKKERGKKERNVNLFWDKCTFALGECIKSATCNIKALL